MSKVKKLTNKEFKAILNDCGINFEIWGYEGILNYVIRCLYNDAKQDIEKGFTTLAESDRERANKLYDILEKRGYYG